jgi:hypothetical protein
MELTATEGVATGEAEGLDDAFKVKTTLLTTLLELSAMYMMPEDASMVTLYG